MLIHHTIGQYVALKPLGDDFICRCPFHQTSKKMMVVIPALDYFECLECGRSGDELAWRRLLDVNSSPCRGVVYVLELSGKKFYIGFTTDLKRRLQEHCAGIGSCWTKKHPPKRLIETFSEADLEIENDVTRFYICLYGEERVRGGHFISRREPYSFAPLNYQCQRELGLCP